MDVGTLANVATATAVVTGLIFGIVEIRHARREREERAAYEVVHAIMTPEWIRSIVLVQSINEHIAPEELEGDRKLVDAAHSVGIILEALGYAVFKGIVPLRVADELVGGSVRVAWRKMRGYVEFERARSGSQKSWEWFQWLAERLEEFPGPATLERGAHEVYRHWRP